MMSAMPRERSVFQSTPAIAGRRIASWFALARVAMFQSTPAIAGRRIRRRNGHRHLRSGFNPLRPLLAGESPGAGGRPVFEEEFQSTPAIAGRRISPRWSAASARRRFNPLRPLLAGESC